MHSIFSHTTTKFCEFEKLNTADTTQSADDELIQMRLIDSMAKQTDHMKLLEFVQAAAEPPSLDSCVQLAQQLELIQCFNTNVTIPGEGAANGDLGSISIANIDRHKTSSAVFKCKYCGKMYPRVNCPAYVRHVVNVAKRTTLLLCARVH